MLNGCLETRLVHRDEHRDTPRPRDNRLTRPTASGWGLGALKDGVIVELGIARQAELPPVLVQALDDELRRETLPAGPGCDQIAVPPPAGTNSEATVAVGPDAGRAARPDAGEGGRWRAAVRHRDP